MSLPYKAFIATGYTFPGKGNGVCGLCTALLTALSLPQPNRYSSGLGTGLCPIRYEEAPVRTTAVPRSLGAARSHPTLRPLEIAFPLNSDTDARDQPPSGRDPTTYPQSIQHEGDMS